MSNRAISTGAMAVQPRVGAVGPRQMWKKMHDPAAGVARVLCRMKMPWRYKSSLRRMRSELFQSLAMTELSTSSL
ncbi:hypothetical protein D3C87_1761640 [compost metagenome]